MRARVVCRATRRALFEFSRFLARSRRNRLNWILPVAVFLGERGCSRLSLLFFSFLPLGFLSFLRFAPILLFKVPRLSNILSLRPPSLSFPFSFLFHSSSVPAVAPLHHRMKLN